MQEEIIKQAAFAGKDVLEIGVGYGAFTFAYLTKARSILGIEPDPEAIESTIEEAPDYLIKPRYAFQAGDIREIELDEYTFDAAVFSNSF